jgi:hypothetical protein
MKAIIYNENGQITRLVDVPPELIALQPQANEYVLIGVANLETQYVNVETAEILDRPRKPHDHSKFNWQTKQWEDDPATAKRQVLSKRQQLLSMSDWTDTVSASTRLENYNAWQFYRQQLRDITTQEGYPFNVVWPTQPS